MNIQFLEQLATMSESDLMLSLIFREYTYSDDSTFENMIFKNGNDYIVRKNLEDFVVVAFLTDDVKRIQDLLSDDHDYIYAASAMTKDDGFVTILTNNKFGVVLNNFTDKGSISIAPVKSAFIQNAIFNYRQARVPNFKNNVSAPNKGCLVFATLFIMALISICSFV